MNNVKAIAKFQSRIDYTGWIELFVFLYAWMKSPDLILMEAISFYYSLGFVYKTFTVNQMFFVGV